MYRDIIERAIEQFAAAIVKIMHLRQIKKEEEAVQLIEIEILKLTGMYLSNFLTLPENISHDLIFKKYADQPEYLIHLADLLKEHAEIQLDNGKVSESIAIFHRALNILTEISKKEQYAKNSKLRKKIQYLKTRV